MPRLVFHAGFTACLLIAISGSVRAEEKVDLFGRDNLTAWCIVPFDAKKRNPEARVAMLKALGFRHYAYDWRAEHLASFDRELQLLKENKIELDAVWFPGQLNNDAKTILGLLKKHQLKPQLWVMVGESGSKEQAEKVDAAVKALRPIAEEAARIDCKVALYNHGGWFGMPDNQLAIIEALKMPNVGMVYNLHHGHDHLERFRFKVLLKKMMPHLLALNINGMTPRGDQTGKKILALGKGDLDAQVLFAIRESGYKGRIGILGHTQDDVELRLRDNLDGLDWLLPQLEGKTPGPKPKYRTP